LEILAGWGADVDEGFMFTPILCANEEAHALEKHGRSDIAHVTATGSTIAVPEVTVVIFERNVVPEMYSKSFVV
jgi:hypothetical protein